MMDWPQGTNKEGIVRVEEAQDSQSFIPKDLKSCALLENSLTRSAAVGVLLEILSVSLNNECKIVEWNQKDRGTQRHALMWCNYIWFTSGILLVSVSEDDEWQLSSSISSSSSELDTSKAPCFQW